MKNARQGVSSLSAVLPRLNSKHAFSMVELLVVVAIMGIILSAMFANLSIGELAFPLASTKLDVQFKARMIVDEIARDVRQARIYEIYNDPFISDSHITFHKVTGFDINTFLYILDSNSITYTYDNAQQKITRDVANAAGVVTDTRVFYNVIAAPFYAKHVVGAVVTEVALNTFDLQNNKMLIIRITAQKQFRGKNIPYTLKEAVRIRNGQ